MSATLSQQQLRSIVEERWQRDPEAFAVGLHVANGLTFPTEVEFDFGKAEIVRADTVFRCERHCSTPNRSGRRSSS